MAQTSDAQRWDALRRAAIALAKAIERLGLDKEPQNGVPGKRYPLHDIIVTRAAPPAPLTKERL